MFASFDVIFLLFAVVVPVYLWFESMRIRELVIQHCTKLCLQCDLQLLDQTVALVSISFARNARGYPDFIRKYQFEVSEDGVDRHKGLIILRGSHIVESLLQGPAGTNIFHQSRLH